MQLPRTASSVGRPAHVATAIVLDGLAEEGLEVLDFGVEHIAVGSAAATVRVAATHRGAKATAPHMSVYVLALVREGSRRWRLASFEQAQ